MTDPNHQTETTQNTTSNESNVEWKAFLDDVVAGLSLPSKTLPYKYFYDERGSRLFDQICECEEYYLTRTESTILAEYAKDIGEHLGPDIALVEPGAGSSIKVRLLLPHLASPVAYVPVDISREHLLASCTQLQEIFPQVPVVPVVADYSTPLSLPDMPRAPKKKVIFYPGSTIGNFEPSAAVSFLERFAHFCGEGGALLIGFDRHKDTGVLEAAYNDSKGVTAKFHLNLLHRIQNELDSDIDPDTFAHSALFNEAKSRIEMKLVSLIEQRIRVGPHVFSFAQGETITTEYSYKRTPESMTELAQQAGFQPKKLWTDENGAFAVMLFEVLEGRGLNRSQIRR